MPTRPKPSSNLHHETQLTNLTAEERCSQLGIIVKQASDHKFIATFAHHVLAVGDTLAQARDLALVEYGRR